MGVWDSDVELWDRDIAKWLSGSSRTEGYQLDKDVAVDREQ